MSKNNSICDVHVYPKKPNVEFLLLWLQFLGGVMCFHPLKIAIINTIGLSFETQETKGELKQQKNYLDPYNHITLKVLKHLF